MSSEAHRAGITPYVVRLAAYYAAMGLGVYVPQGYSWFDKVEVTLEAPWTANPEAPALSMQVLRVSFYEGVIRRRYVEFAQTLAGYGGEPLVRLISESGTLPPPIPPEEE